MGTKHTPGPWKVKNKTSVVAGDKQVASCGFKMGDWTPEEFEEERANARAIAAVPAMIGALRDLVEDFGAMTGGCESLDVARAILKHIDGGA